MANEKRLIDANALRTDTMVMCGVNEAVLENCYPYWQFNKAIVNAPTVDAVEVVRCKDCKRYYYSDFSMSMRCRLDGVDWGKDDFCSKGERKCNG